MVIFSVLDKQPTLLCLQVETLILQTSRVSEKHTQEKYLADRLLGKQAGVRNIRSSLEELAGEQ